MNGVQIARKINYKTSKIVNETLAFITGTAINIFWSAVIPFSSMLIRHRAALSSTLFYDEECTSIIMQSRIEFYAD